MRRSARGRASRTAWAPEPIPAGVAESHGGVPWLSSYPPPPDGLRTVPRKPPRGRDSGPWWGSLYPLLDLHGLTGDDARIRADAWLRARRDERVRTVMLVTGRGNRSAGPPVLLGEVEHLLHGLRGGVVESFTFLPGGGGFQVELARPAPPPPRTVAEERAARRVRTSAPELRRRAEESLWELGIAPTPALLDAEIQRLLRAEPEGEE